MYAAERAGVSDLDMIRPCAQSFEMSSYWAEGKCKTLFEALQRKVFEGLINLYRGSVYNLYCAPLESVLRDLGFVFEQESFPRRCIPSSHCELFNNDERVRKLIEFHNHCLDCIRLQQGRDFGMLSERKAWLRAHCKYRGDGAYADQVEELVRKAHEEGAGPGRLLLFLEERIAAERSEREAWFSR